MAHTNLRRMDTASEATTLVERAAATSQAIVTAALDPKTESELRSEIEGTLLFERPALETASLHMHDLLAFLTLAHASSLIAQTHRNEPSFVDGGQPDPDGWERNTQALIAKALNCLGLISVAPDEPAKAKVH